MRYEVRGTRYRTGRRLSPQKGDTQKLVPHTSYLVSRTSYLGVLVALLIAALAIHSAAEADAIRRAPPSLLRTPHAPLWEPDTRATQDPSSAGQQEMTIAVNPLNP